MTGYLLIESRDPFESNDVTDSMSKYPVIKRSPLGSSSQLPPRPSWATFG